jgi:tRNA(Ile)-lysidine synthase
VVQRVAVAVSGGRDSTALWHATARAARGSALQVIGLHVHHGLQPEADAWVRHLQAQARRWAARGLPVSLQWHRLQGAPAVGDSIEAWPRRGRYAALAEMARACGAGVVLLAHHRRDQAETFLLQALRGAGAAGLAGMPAQAVRDGIVWARPWLDHPREAIEAYVRRHRLSFVEDPSNGDRRLARNRLRQAVWPALATSFEHAETSFAASARRAQESTACLRELAELDARLVCPGADALDVAAWTALSTARRANLLRAWLGSPHDAGVPESLVQRLLQELPATATGTWPRPGGLLRLHRGRLHRVPGGTGDDLPPRAPARIDLSRAGRIAVPEWCGSFEVEPVHTGGIEPLRLRGCELRARCGGERFQRLADAPARSLKKQFQAAGVPAWLRDGPLLFSSAHELLFVAGLGIDARHQAPRGVAMLGLRWLPDVAAAPC